MAEPVLYIDLPGERIGLRVLGLVILAVWNLISLENLTPTFLWLAIVGFTLKGIRRDGWKSEHAGLLAETFGHGFYGLTGEHLLAGHTVWGRRLMSDTVPLADIKCVKWSPGQATAMAKRDMKDWFISVWFDPGEGIERSKRAGARGIVVIGPSRRKELAEAEGMALVERLRAAGVPLVREEDEKSRVRFVVGKSG